MSTGRPLKVDMESILDAMTRGPSDPGEHFLNTEQGEVVVLLEAGFGPKLDDLRDEIDAAPLGRFEPIPRTRAEYDWMRDFAATVDDDELRSRLEDALAGRGAFQRSRDVVFRDQELRSRWLHTRRDALVREASAWLGSIGIDPTFGPRRSRRFDPFCAHESRRESTPPDRTRLIWHQMARRRR